MKVLIVDDDRVSRSVLRAFLKQHTSCWVIEAGDGIEALAAVQSDTPALMFLDLGLPTLSGLEVLEALRRDATHAKLPVIVLSGTGAPAVVQQAIKLGIEDYLVKPLKPKVMERRILRVLEDIQTRKPAAGRSGATPATGRREGAKRVVVADRDANFRAFFAGLFQDTYDLAQAENGVEALRACLESPPDIVCLGEGLPLMAEELLARKIRDVLKATPPLIFLCSDRAGATATGLYDGVLRRSLVPDTFRADFARLLEAGDDGPQAKLTRLLRGEVGAEVVIAVRQTVGVMVGEEIDLPEASTAAQTPTEVRSGVVLQLKEGDLSVRVGLGGSRVDATWFAARLLGAEPTSDQQITDAFGGLANTIGGRIVASLEPHGFPASLGPPWTALGGEPESPAPVLQVPFVVGERRFVVGVAMVEAAA
jgi:DNA-binding response OmpR family regulator/CheY-specific phosphatase CheX